MPLGSFPGSSYDEVSFDLASGDVFVFCSDGVFEAADAREEEFGSARLIAVVEQCKAGTARQIVDAIFAEVQAVPRRYSVQRRHDGGGHSHHQLTRAARNRSAIHRFT